jgi:hypothetical protein
VGETNAQETEDQFNVLTFHITDMILIGLFCHFDRQDLDVICLKKLTAPETKTKRDFANP